MKNKINTILFFSSILSILIIYSCRRNNSNPITTFKVKSEVFAQNGTMLDSISRTYDTQGRVSTVNFSVSNIFISYSYGGDSVIENYTTSGLSRFTVYKLNTAGRAISAYSYPTRDLLIFNYDNNGYLIKSYDTLSHWGETYTMSGGNVMTQIDSNSNPSQITTYTCSYTNIANNQDFGQPYLGQLHSAQHEDGTIFIYETSSYFLSSQIVNNTITGLSNDTFAYTFDNLGRLKKTISAGGTIVTTYQYY